MGRTFDSVRVLPAGADALSTLGAEGTVCTHHPDDLFRTPEIALAARDRAIRLDLVVCLRDPRDLLADRSDSGTDYALDGETILLVHQLIDELARSGLIPGGIVFVRQEDLRTTPEATAALLSERLGLARGSHPVSVPARPAPDASPRWQDPEARQRILDQFHRHIGLHAVLAEQGYAADPGWFAALAGQPARPAVPRPDPDRMRSWGRDLTVLHDDDSLRVTLLDGEGDHAIVTFIGVGMGVGGIDQQSEEFRKLGPGLGPQLFVFDKQRSWGNALDLDLLARLTAPYRHGRQVTALGLSMGGFLAVLASGPIGADRVIAFAPQYAMHPEVAPFENRWRAYTDRIGSWRVRSLDGAFVPGCVYYAIVPQDRRDLAHLGLFPDRPNVHRIAVRSRHHNVAAALKARGLLYPTIWAAIGGADPADMPFGTTNEGGVWQVALDEDQASSSASQ